jgi:hypothetical protein
MSELEGQSRNIPISSHYVNFKDWMSSDGGKELLMLWCCYSCVSDPFRGELDCLSIKPHDPLITCLRTGMRMLLKPSTSQVSDGSQDGDKETEMK